MKKLLFNDGQTLQVQSVDVNSGTMKINIINNAYEQLKHTFTDSVATQKISVQNEKGNIVVSYENFTVFESIQENSGGIFIVKLQQKGKDTATKLEELAAANKELAEQNEVLTACVLELSELVYQ